MARVLYTVGTIVGPETRSSSIPKFQYANYLSEAHETTILAKEEIKEEKIRKQAETIRTSPGSGLLGTLIFPMFITFHVISSWGSYDLFATDDWGVSVLPFIILSRFSTNWVIFCDDTPEGQRIRRRRNGIDWSLETVYLELLDTVSRVSFRFADEIIVTDGSRILPSDKTTLVKGGVDCKFISDVESNSEYKINCYQNNNPESVQAPIRIIYAGNMYIHRGIDIILDAVKESESEYKLILIGPPPERGGEEVMSEFRNYYSKSFTQLVDEYSEKIEYKGFLSDHRDVIEEMIRADIGLCILPYDRQLPHYYTSYIIKIFEYMSTGTSILATKTRATEDLLTPDQLIEENDSTILANKIDNFCSNTELRRSCCENNLNNSEKHCWDHLWREFDEALNPLLETTQKRN